MRCLIALAALILPAVPAHAQERTVPITDFDRIVIEGPFAVQLVRGNVTRGVVSGSRQSIEAVSVEVQGQTLRIRRNPNAWGSTPASGSQPAQVRLTGRTLRSARVIGAGSLSLDGITAQRLQLSLEGNGRIDATRLQADDLSVAVRGAGTMKLAGAAANFQAAIQGSGTFEGGGLRVDNATISAAATGPVTLNVVRSANVTATGIGGVEVTGTAACTVRGPSADTVRCGPAR